MSNEEECCLLFLNGRIHTVVGQQDVHVNNYLNPTAQILASILSQNSYQQIHTHISNCPLTLRVGQRDNKTSMARKLHCGPEHPGGLSQLDDFKGLSFFVK